MSTPRIGTRRRTEQALDLQRRRGEPLPGWARTRTARRALALLPVLTLVLGVLAATAGGGALTAVLLGVTSVVGSCAIATLRRVTGMLDGAPADLLDERELGDRDRAHRRGFRLTLVLLGVLVALAVGNGLLDQETGTPLIGSVGWMALLLTAFWTAGALPAAALAWDGRPAVEDPDADPADTDAGLTGAGG
ncbi:hypothetical protein AB2L27_19715 [Kineococcus sp. LSe6-4]|uniref:Uncharacterized protein n=1 Tax=Kineococcus halophytocola TaxID=3234027 RepID=A0ABV4H864_9ACTN